MSSIESLFWLKESVEIHKAREKAVSGVIMYPCHSSFMLHDIRERLALSRLHLTYCSPSESA